MSKIKEMTGSEVKNIMKSESNLGNFLISHVFDARDKSMEKLIWREKMGSLNRKQRIGKFGRRGIITRFLCILMEELWYRYEKPPDETCTFW